MMNLQNSLMYSYFHLQSPPLVGEDARQQQENNLGGKVDPYQCHNTRSLINNTNAIT